MSNALAIAAVTATLRNLLEAISHKFPGMIISTKPPDEARSDKSNQLNLFLYQVLPNAAWRNMDIPQVTRSGPTSAAPLALNLYYMLTAYGDQNDDVAGHQLLGHAMSILFDHCHLVPKKYRTQFPALATVNCKIKWNECVLHFNRSLWRKSFDYGLVFRHNIGYQWHMRLRLC